jgi:hypothetical protein
MKAMRNDDFNTILELKMRGYQPSENTLKSLQPDISSTTFIAAVKIFQMEGVLKSLQDIKSAQSPITSGNKRNMEQTNLLFNFQFFSISKDEQAIAYAELQKALFFCQRKKIPLLFVSLKGMIDDIRFLNLLEESHVDFRCIDFPWFCKENLPLIKAVVLYEKLEIRINVCKQSKIGS